ncbi:hypothetical protein GF324_14525 [bacterium]|nr:hypothetical protein [bacterium]
MKSPQVEKRLAAWIGEILARMKRHPDGIIDPHLRRDQPGNARYQEACLTLALASKHEAFHPEGVLEIDLQNAAVQAVEGLLTLQHKSGGFRAHPAGKPETHTTAYGIYACSRTLKELGDQAPSHLHQRAGKAIRKAARFVMQRSLPPGVELRAVQYAAFQTAADWLQDFHLYNSAERFHREARQQLERVLSLERHGGRPTDAGGLSLALAYLTTPTERKMELPAILIDHLTNRCIASLTPSGLYGGGGEGRLNSLPIPLGFERYATDHPTAAAIAAGLYDGWEANFYMSALDHHVSYLTPLSYLVLEAALIRRSRSAKQYPADYEIEENLWSPGEGRMHLQDWILRLGPGGTIGWLYHRPSDSSRIFGSPDGLALREGPWIIKGNLIRQPALAGTYKVTNKQAPYRVEGELPRIPLPGAKSRPRGIGLRGRATHRDSAQRIVPAPSRISPRPGAGTPYRREIEMKDGALTIETWIEGRVMHRIPLIWLGGHWGKLAIDEVETPPDLTLMEQRIRKIQLSDHLHPDWTMRFDKPVDVLYEPIHGAVNMHPMRYLAVAAASLDVISENRMHVAIRVR